MSITKTIFSVTAIAAFATAACAQDATYTDRTEVLDAQALDSFTLSDANADGGLDRAEFQAYLETQAGAGDADATAMVESGDYDVQFMTKDVNADGLVDASELAPAAEEPVIEESYDEDPIQ